MDAVHSLTSFFGGLLLLAIVAAGFVMMFAPARARELLKNLAIALSLFTAGTMLLQACCGRLR
jgi:hypothetical protein